MKLPATRLRVLMCVALLGVLLLIGLVAAAVLGAAGAVVFALLAVFVVVVGVGRGRAALAPTPLPPGRSCTCCTTSQHDPVRII